MQIRGIEFPEAVLSAIRNGRLVVFAGAGVSMGKPARLPGFHQLALQIAEGTGQLPEKDEPDDHFLGRLQHGKIEVHNIAASLLSQKGLEHTPLHRDLLRLYSEPESVRLVTTNFDLLFEQAAENVFGQRPEVFRAPALPLGRDFKGVLHIHGAVSHPHELVLTDADFGRAYLTEGWARRFLVDLFQHWTVLFVGYRHNDVVVSYLARAIPRDSAQRFALTPDTEDLRRWNLLGIEPITYDHRGKNDHTQLCEGVGRLADIVRRTILDWQREIVNIASKAPPIDGETICIIEHALEDVVTTRFFTEAASSVAWIEWLDGRKHLDGLFENGCPSERNEYLACWLAKRFLASNPEDLFLLIASHKMRLSSVFWLALAREVAWPREQTLDNALLSRWISLLLETFPPGSDSMLQWLGERCIEQGNLSILLDILNVMARRSLQLRPGFVWPRSDGSVAGHKIDVDVTPTADHHALRDIWEKGLRPKLDQVAEPLLVQLFRCLDSYHSVLRAWQKAGPGWDPLSWRRSAIEPHNQDRYPQTHDVLIDAARDSLEWLIQNRIDAASRWCEYFSQSEVPILRRLALHATNMRKDISADEKLEWVLTHGGLHDVQTHHEVYRLVALAYPGAGLSSRRNIIEAVLAFEWPHEEEPERETRTARVHFDWLHWIHVAAPECALAKQALDNVMNKYSGWRPHEHPDLTHWTTEGGSDRPRPWSTETLLAKPAQEWFEELLAFQSSDFTSGRWDLLSVVKEAAKSQPTWGFDLADSLAKESKWDADLWGSLIRAWSEGELDEIQAKRVLDWMGREELHAVHAYDIASALHAMVKNDGKPYVWQLLAGANSIASALWRTLGRDDATNETHDWVTLAINRPAGILAEFWLESLSLWRRHEHPVPDVSDDDYRQALSAIAEDQSLAGRLGRTILASQFAFLLASDEAWTRSCLLPLFDPDNNALDFLAAWDGFLTWGRLDPPVLDAMGSAFLKAVPRLKDELVNQRNRFIEYYALALGSFVDNPLDKWIPELLRNGGEEAGNLFTSHIEHFLRDLDDRGQRDWWGRWLKRYWGNRIQGVPVPLSQGEIQGMVNWLTHLPAVFPEAVDLTIRMPKNPLNLTTMMYDLNKSDLPEQYSDSVAMLLMYLGSPGSPRHVWYKAKEIIDRLLETNISPELKQRLRELAATLGLE